MLRDNSLPPKRNPNPRIPKRFDGRHLHVNQKVGASVLAQETSPCCPEYWATPGTSQTLTRTRFACKTQIRMLQANRRPSAFSILQFGEVHESRPKTLPSTGSPFRNARSGRLPRKPHHSRPAQNARARWAKSRRLHRRSNWSHFLRTWKSVAPSCQFAECDKKPVSTAPNSPPGTTSVPLRVTQRSRAFSIKDILVA